jgi:hypothetical protein
MTLKGHSQWRIRSAIVVIFFAAVTFWCAAEPVVERNSQPGLRKGYTDSHWGAPFLLVTKFSVEERFVTSVKWFDENGKVTKELSSPGVHDRGDYISEYSDGKSIIHGITGDWKFALPEKPDIKSWDQSVRGRGDMFVHEFRPSPEMMSMDIYRKGVLVGSFGPFVKNYFDAHIGEDGSVTFMTWKNAEKNDIQVMVIGSDGKLQFKENCGEKADEPFPLAGGAGVVLQDQTRKDPPVRFKYVGLGGGTASYDIGPNATPLLSVPNTDMLLFSTALGQGEGFELVHGATGKTVWEIPSPIREYPSSAIGAMLTGKKILLLGLGTAAIDLKTGQVIAIWEPDRDESSWGRFFSVGTKLFIFTQKEFFQLHLPDIDAKRNGWH